jgi:hypothetical protein
MSPEAALTAVETAIRDAIVSDSFAEANALLDCYVAHVERLLRSLPPGSAAARTLRVRAFDLFGWTRMMTLAGREYSLAELDRLQSVSRYHNSPASPACFGADA